MRLIDADALKRYVDRQKAQGDAYIGLIFEDAVKMIVDRQPTVDAVPVVHGKWILGKILHHEMMKCSECLHSYNVTGVFSYCPNCGAKMDKE